MNKINLQDKYNASFFSIKTVGKNDFRRSNEGAPEWPRPRARLIHPRPSALDLDRN